jgi:beta-mannosidase
VQLNESNGAIEVVNNSPDALTGLTVHATIYSFDSRIDLEKNYAVSQVPGSTTVKAAQIEVNARISPLYFVKLDLLGSDSRLISSNFYWQNVAQDDFAGLMKLPTAMLEATAVSHAEGDNTVLTVALQNPTGTIALMTHLQLHQKQSGKRVLPVFYSDNYITLVPKESRTITILAATKALERDTPLLLIDGFNVDVKPVEGSLPIAPNLNAQPSHWPASNIVPD